MSLDSSAATYMRRALELAGLGWGQVHPNPMVGAVVVRDGAVVGEGYHRRYGEAHAEVDALRAAGEAARGATLYVTLEPCTHQGKTPPCAEAIVAAGITTVVIATADPNPRARGGAEQLRAAGITVFTGVEHGAARELNASFFYVHEHGAPYVVLKLALSADGHIAARAGTRSALTGSAANREVQRLRAGFDAIMVGSNTVYVDDPLLTVRDYPVRTPPVRIVLDSAARMRTDARLAQSLAEAPLWIVVADDAPADRTAALRSAGARVLHAPRSADGVELTAMLSLLAAHGIRTIFAEGGARVANALLQQALVQRVYLFFTRHVLGPDGVPAFAAGASEVLGNFEIVQRHRFGDDVLCVLDRRR